MADELDLGTLVGYLKLDNAGWNNPLTAAGRGLDGFKGKAILGLSAVGAAGIAVGVGLYKVGEVFDDLSDTIAVGTDASGAKLDSLVDSAKRIGTEVPVSFDKIGPVVAVLNKRLGLTGNALETLSEQFLAYEKISGEALDPAAVTASFAAYGVGAKDTSKTLDTLFKISRDTQVPLSQLIDDVKSGAPNLTRFGLSIDGAASLLGNLAAKGVDGGRVMQGLNKAAASFAKEGIPLKKGLTDTVEGVEALLKKGDQAGAQNLAGKVFGTRGAAAFIQAVKSGALSVDSLTKATETSGRGILESEKNTRDFAEQWDLLKNRVLVGLAPIAERVFAAVGDGMEWIANVGIPALGRLNDGFDHSGGKMSKFAGNAAKIWADIQQIFTAAIDIIESLWDTFGATLTDFTVNRLANLAQIFSGAFEVISGIFNTVAALLHGDWSGVWDGLLQILHGFLSIAKGLISELWNIIVTLFRLGGAAIVGIFGGVWDKAKDLVSSGASNVVGMIAGIPGKIRALGGVFKSAGRSLIEAFIDGLKNAGGFISGIAGSIWKVVKEMLNGAIDKINAALEFKVDLPLGKSIGINPKNIPHLAAGGYVDQPTLAVIGEAGPEVVVPLSGRRGKDALNEIGTGNGGNGRTLIVNASGLSPEQAVDAFGNAWWFGDNAA